jgi:type I restriction enzyme S subunit
VKTETRYWGEIKKGFTHFAEGDVVLAKITPCFQNGKAAVMQGLANNVGAGTTELHVFRPIDGSICPEYVLAYLKSPKFLMEGIPRMTGTAGQKRVPNDYFAQNPFPLPPLEEQRRIVGKVDELMRLCDELEAQQQAKRESRVRLNTAILAPLNKAASLTPEEFEQATTRLADNFDMLYDSIDAVSKLRATILQLAVQGELVSQDPSDEPAFVLLEEIKKTGANSDNGKKGRNTDRFPATEDYDTPFTLPHGWRWSRFVDIATIASNLVQPSDYLDYPHVAPDNIEKFTGRLLPYRTVREDKVSSSNHKFFEGQIVYSKIRPNLAKVVIVDFEGLCSADM